MNKPNPFLIVKNTAKFQKSVIFAILLALFLIKHKNIITLHWKSPLQRSFTACNRYGQEGCDRQCTCATLQLYCIALITMYMRLRDGQFYVNCT